MKRRVASKRVRRSPEEARELILAGALRLFAKSGPDAVGLKDVAREVGVSHALVTHYFGTREKLIEAAFQAHAARGRAELFARVGESPGDLRAWIDAAAAHLGDPLYGRLVAWALLAGRLEGDDFFTGRDCGLRAIADLVETHLKKRASREKIELSILVVLSSMVGYTLSRRALWAALGRKATDERDAGFRRHVADLIVGLAR